VGLRPDPPYLGRASHDSCLKDRDVEDSKRVSRTIIEKRSFFEARCSVDTMADQRMKQPSNVERALRIQYDKIDLSLIFINNLISNEADPLVNGHYCTPKIRPPLHAHRYPHPRREGDGVDTLFRVLS